MQDAGLTRTVRTLGYALGRALKRPQPMIGLALDDDRVGALEFIRVCRNLARGFRMRGPLRCKDVRHTGVAGYGREERGCETILHGSGVRHVQCAGDRKPDVSNSDGCRFPICV